MAKKLRTWRPWWLGLAAVPLLAACSASSPPVAYSVSIDTTFTSDEVDATLAALDDWRTALPELELSLSIAPCDGSLPRHACIRPSHDSPNPIDDVVGATFPGASDDATVLIYVDRIQSAGMDVATLTKQTVAHEMGHVMGLRHSSAGQLMAATVPEQAHGVTAEDVAQFWEVHP